MVIKCENEIADLSEKEQERDVDSYQSCARAPSSPEEIFRLIISIMISLVILILRCDFSHCHVSCVQFILYAVTSLQLIYTTHFKLYLEIII